MLGVRLPDVGEETETAPWMRPPSRVTPLVRTTEPVPDRVRAVLAQRLFVEKAGLPSALLNQVKRLAAFQNPEVLQKTELAAVHSADAADHYMRGEPAAAHRAFALFWRHNGVSDTFECHVDLLL